MNLWNVYVPVDRAQRTNQTFGLMMIRKPSIPGLIYLLWPFIMGFNDEIFDQDWWTAEEEQKSFDRQGADWNQEVFLVIQNKRTLLGREGLTL